MGLEVRGSLDNRIRFAARRVAAAAKSAFRTGTPPEPSQTARSSTPALERLVCFIMAGPKSSTPKPVRPSRPKRRFTLAQANSTLPLVKRIVGDIVRTHGLVLRCQAELERAPAGKDRSATQLRLDEAVNHLEDYVDELGDVGCELKDYQIGLIDFVGRHQRRDVYLCWKLGEERIGYWHEFAAGYAGRQPVSTLREDAE